MARAKLQVKRSIWIDNRLLQGESHPFLFACDCTDCQKTTKGNSNNNNNTNNTSTNTRSLISRTLLFTVSEAAAVCEVIQDFIQLPASQHPYNVDSVRCRCIFLTSAERSLLSLWSCTPSNTASS